LEDRRGGGGAGCALCTHQVQELRAVRLPAVPHATTQQLRDDKVGGGGVAWRTLTSPPPLRPSQCVTPHSHHQLPLPPCPLTPPTTIPPHSRRAQRAGGGTRGQRRRTGCGRRPCRPHLSPTPAHSDEAGAADDRAVTEQAHAPYQWAARHACCARPSTRQPSAARERRRSDPSGMRNAALCRRRCSHDAHPRPPPAARRRLLLGRLLQHP
jgi:hypothetical protein